MVPKIISPQDWAAKYGVKMAQKVIVAMLKQRDQIGEENYRVMFSLFMAGLISAFLRFSLTEFTQGSQYSEAEMSKFAEKNFANLKQLLGNSLASGVQGGVQSWSGQEIEYFCIIKPVPDAINSKPC